VVGLFISICCWLQLFEDLTESETKDDFYYFGAKKYKSKTRNLATEDKYKPLWIGAEATEEKDPSGAICTNTKYLQVCVVCHAVSFFTFVPYPFI